MSWLYWYPSSMGLMPQLPQVLGASVKHSEMSLWEMITLLGGMSVPWSRRYVGAVSRRYCDQDRGGMRGCRAYPPPS